MTDKQELEMKLEQQKQTLTVKDDTIKKLMEHLQSKGITSQQETMELEKLRTRNIELETRLRHMESVAEIKERDSFRVSLIPYILLSSGEPFLSRLSLSQLSLSPQEVCFLLKVVSFLSDMC